MITYNEDAAEITELWFLINIMRIVVMHSTLKYIQIQHGENLKKIHGIFYENAANDIIRIFFSVKVFLYYLFFQQLTNHD